jgi:ATP-binding cassette subfamily B protein
MDVAAVSWPAGRLAEGLELLARAAGFPHRASPRTFDAEAGATDPDAALKSAGTRLGLDVDAIDASFGEIESVLRAAGPAVIRVGADAFVFLIKRRGSRLTVIGPDHRPARLPLATLRRALIEPEAAPLVADAEKLVGEAVARSARRATVARALVADRLRARRLTGLWLLRLPPGASFAAQIVSAGGRRSSSCGARPWQDGLWIATWWLLAAAPEGRLDSSWLTVIRALHARPAGWRRSGCRDASRSRSACASSNAFSLERSRSIPRTCDAKAPVTCSAA